MSWACCPICTGAHDTSECAKAQHIIRTHTGLQACSPIEPAPNNVVELITEWTHRRQPTGRRALVHHRRQARDHQGVEVLRLA